MTEQQWSYHTPERDGHAPDDWDEDCEWQYQLPNNRGWGIPSSGPNWSVTDKYRYRPLQDATYEPDLLAQCLALPQDQREALIEAMQKPQRDWADDVADTLWYEIEDDREATLRDMATVIRSMCRPKEGACDG